MGHILCTLTPSCDFMTGCEIHTFITLTGCNSGPHVMPPSALGQRLPSWGIHGVPDFVPPPGPATASRLQARHPAPSGSSWTLISLLRDPNTLELRAYRKEPDPHDIGDPNPLPGPSHLMPALGDVLRRSSLLLRAQHP